MDVVIVGLGGGIGAARLWRALDAAGQDLTVVVNTADDLWHYGLRVCPDLDTNLYWLSGRADCARGWGLAGETFTAMAAVGELGEDPWFGLGDRDLATHLLRTQWLRDGVRPSTVAARLRERMGVRPVILPMTEAEVATQVRTAEGWLGFQDFLVRRGARDRALEVRWAGIESAVPTLGMLDAIANADLVIIAPSNPVASVLPILALPGVRKFLRSVPVVAVTPVVRGVPIADPGEAGRARCRAALLAARGVEHTATAVAALYADVADRFVVDEADAGEAADIPNAVVAPTLVHHGAPLVDTLLAVAA